MTEDRSAPPPPGRDTSVHGAAFWVSVAVGVAVMAWGIRLFLEGTTDNGDRLNFAVYVVGADLLHDGLWAPVACLVGVVVARFVRAPWRAPLQVGLIATAAVLFVAYAPLRGTAEPVGNPTIQPLDYVSATVTVLGVVWLAVVVWAAVRWWRGKPREDA